MILQIVPDEYPEVSNSLAAAGFTSVPKHKTTRLDLSVNASVSMLRWKLKSDLIPDFDNIIYYASGYTAIEKAKLELVVDFSVRMSMPLIILAPFAFAATPGDNRARNWFLDRADELEGKNSSIFFIGNYTPTEAKSKTIIGLLSNGMFGRYDLNEEDATLVVARRNVQV